MSDETQTPPEDTLPTAAAPPAHPWWRTAIGMVLVVLLLGGAATIATTMIKNKKKAARKRPAVQVRLVEVMPVMHKKHEVTVEALGTVVPAEMISLAPRVSGEVVWINPAFVPGGLLKKGDEILRIDPADYDLAITTREAEISRLQAALDQQKSELLQQEAAVKQAVIEIERRASEVAQSATLLTKAESSLQMEMGQQAIARQEYKLLGDKLSGEAEALVLRKPQLTSAQASFEGAKVAVKLAEIQTQAAEASKQATDARLKAMHAAVKAAEANLAAARTSLSQAKLDRQRTSLKAPFNAVIRDRKALIGSQVSAGTPVAELIGTDEFWVETTLPLDRLRWLDIPGYNSKRGARAQIIDETAWGPGASRTGQVSQLMSDLEPNGRLARVLVTIADPLSLQAPKSAQSPPALILGSYLQVHLAGRPLSSAIKLSRDLVKDGNIVMVMTPEKTLAVRSVTSVWSTRDHMYVTDGLADGEHVILTDLAAPVIGMGLRTQDDEPEPPAKAEKVPMKPEQAMKLKGGE